MNDLVEKMRGFCLPGGAEAVRPVRAVTLAETGEIRSSAEARWMPFAAEERIETRRSGFRWDARVRGSRLISVTDAYEEGRGRLVIKLGGVVPVKKMAGPEMNQGELQRYLASIPACPAILVNHPSLEWTLAGPLALRVREGSASIDIDLNEAGQPLACRAERPRLVGRRAVPTSWSATYSGFREWEGMRVATRIDVFWTLSEGPFCYFRSEILSLAVDR